MRVYAAAALVALGAASTVGCVGPVDPALAHAPTPEQVSQAVGESARHMGPDQAVAVFGWHVEIVGDRVHWRECTAATACTFNDRETDARNVLHSEAAGEATVAAAEGPRTVKVERLTLRSGSPMSP